MRNKKIYSKQIDALLPQTQCGECGYPGCMPYAEAMASGLAPLNLCPPGGQKTVVALGELLNVDTSEYTALLDKPVQVAKIREDECIGCTKCITACPVDAIIGTNKHMHTIIEFECTGCELCVEPCPVDCIDILPLEEVQGAALYEPNKARERHTAKKIRDLQERQAQNDRYLAKRKLAANSQDKQAEVKAKQDYILKAMQRAQLKKQGKNE